MNCHKKEVTRSFRNRVGELFSTKTFGLVLPLLLLISSQAFSSESLNPSEKTSEIETLREKKALVPAEPVSGLRNPKVRVYVNVTSTKNTKNSIERCLSRELKALGDVVQSREEIDYVLDVAALKVHQKDKEIGFVLSVTMRRKFDSQLVSFIFKDEYRGLGASWTGDLFQFLGSSLRSGPIANIQSMCREIVGELHHLILQAIKDNNEKVPGKQKKALSLQQEEIKKLRGK